MFMERKESHFFILSLWERNRENQWTKDASRVRKESTRELHGVWLRARYRGGYQR